MNLGLALGWKFKHAAGINTLDGKLTSWPPSLGPEPTIAEQADIIAEYEALMANPIPSEISDRQFFQQMAHDGRVTEQEALDAVGSGVIPSAMEALIEMLPTDQQFAARMLVRGATTFRRDHPVTALIGQLYGMSDSEIDDLWRAASVL